MLAVLVDHLKSIGGPLAVAALLCLPLLRIARSERRLTWTGAIGVGTLICAVSLILIAEVPSRILYLYASRHEVWAHEAPVLGFLRGENYFYAADVVANTLQGIFFVVLVALAYLWGERQRRKGRFKAS